MLKGIVTNFTRTLSNQNVQPEKCTLSISTGDKDTYVRLLTALYEAASPLMYEAKDCAGMPIKHGTGASAVLSGAVVSLNLTDRRKADRRDKDFKAMVRIKTIYGPTKKFYPYGCDV